MSLTSNKAVGFDSVSNEMLKCGFNQLQNCLITVFNNILSNGTYPMEWKNAYITPVHKGGSSDDPNTFRGISVLLCTAKLFNTVLTKRLDTFLDRHKVISPMQIGFTKTARTSDHMFVLRTLIEKYTKDYNGKLYTCLIDFRKVFDRVEHNILFYKLRQIGISGNFYNIIKDMYANISLSIKMKSGFTQSFPSNTGVRQGDTLSPDLFKVFINDLPKIFDSSCDGVDISTYHLNCFIICR